MSSVEINIGITVIDIFCLRSTTLDHCVENKIMSKYLLLVNRNDIV